MSLPRLGPPTPPPFDTSFLPFPVRNNPQIKQALGEVYKAAYALGAGDGFSVGFAAGEAAGLVAGVLLGLFAAATVVVIATCVASILRPRPR